MPPRVNIYEYLDYRQFLKDWYEATKRTRAGMSYRTFSKRAGFSSPNTLKLVMEGERNLTPASIEKFILGLKLDSREQEFFRNLVQFNQSFNPVEKNDFYKRLLQSRKFSQLKPIERHQYDYYSKWYNPVIRELVASPHFDGTAEWIAQNIYPPITPAQAEKSMELLKLLGFITKKKGRWQQTTSILSTGPEVKSFVFFNYHKNLLALSGEILESLPAPQRDVSALTLGVSKDRLPFLKKKILEFRQEILKLVASDEPSQVFHINIQLFPVSLPLDPEDMA